MNKRPTTRLFRPVRFKHQNGMTLLEVLVATSILVVISSMAFLSLDTLIKSKQSLEQTTQQLNQFNLAQFQLQTDIQMAVSTNQTRVTQASPEFIANSQSITLLRYRNTIVPNQKISGFNNQQPRQQLTNQRLIRVRWYMRNNQLFRATQSAASPLQSNQWQERALLELNALNCAFQNVAGQMQSIWPNNQTQNTQLPEIVNCQIELANDQVSVLKLVPWQRAGWL